MIMWNTILFYYVVYNSNLKYNVWKQGANVYLYILVVVEIEVEIEVESGRDN